MDPSHPFYNASQAAVASRKTARDETDLDELVAAASAAHEPRRDVVATNPLTGGTYSERYHRIQEQRRRLPMWEWRHRLQDTIAQRKVTLLTGETGSGKSTQLPQFLLGARPAGMILCTQPRRVAAMSVAHRVAEELDVRLGEHVGYSVRFESRRSEVTKILFSTDGMVLREVQRDPLLTAYEYIIIDEAHERSVDTDILLGHLQLVMAQRSDVHVVVMSATLNIPRFVKVFPQAEQISVKGRTFSVDNYFAQAPMRHTVGGAVMQTLRVHREEAPGDILLFLAGRAEIEEAVQLLRRQIEEEAPGSVNVLPLYGQLPLEEQKRVFEAARPNERKIIVATNIAETSLTIDGIVYVVDSGYCKQSNYNPDNMIESLLPCIISKASAEQRRGRAGRTRPGKCFRLYTLDSFDAEFIDQTYPEIQRTNLTNVVLLLFNLGYTMDKFPWIDAPAPRSLMVAVEELEALNAIDVETLRLTDFGKALTHFPTDPNSARALLTAQRYGCNWEVCIIVAMSSAGNDPFLRPRGRLGELAAEAHAKFYHPGGDAMTLLKIFWDYSMHQESATWCRDNYLSHRVLELAARVFRQLALILQNTMKIPLLRSDRGRAQGQFDERVIRRALVNGYVTRVARLVDEAEGKYMLLRPSVTGTLDRDSVFRKLSLPKPRWVLFGSLGMTGKEPSLRRVTPIDVNWLPSISEEYFDPIDAHEVSMERDLRQAFAVHRSGGVPSDEYTGPDLNPQDQRIDLPMIHVQPTEVEMVSAAQAAAHKL